MEKYVFTVRDDVCIANGKDVSATELLAKMKLWGDVEPFERVVASIKAEYQSAVDNLTAQLNSIKEQKLTNDEIILVNCYRECKKSFSEKDIKRIAELEQQLQIVKDEHEVLSTNIIALLQKQN